MKEKMIMWAVEMFISRLSAEDLKKWVEMGLDLLEDKAEESINKFDDKLVTAFAAMVRGAMNMEDNDEPTIDIEVKEIVE